MAINWVDGTTPVNATNLNALEQEVNENTERLDNSIGNCQMIYTRVTAGNTYSFSGSMAVIFCHYSGNAYQMYICRANTVVTVAGHDNITVSADSSNYSVTNNNTGFITLVILVGNA